MIIKLMQDIFIALGGFTAAVLILLRFFKARAEKWIDSEIQLRCSKALAEYEAVLEKKKMYSEEKIRKELEIYDILVNSYEIIWSSFWECVEIIENTIIVSNLTFSTLAENNKFIDGVELVKEQCIKLVKKEATISVYMSKEFYENIKESLEKTLEWCKFLEANVRKYDINENERGKLLNLNSVVKKKLFENLSTIKEQIDIRTI